MSYRLDDEQRAWVRICLARANVALSPGDMEWVVRSIERSIAKYRRAEPEGTFRDTHDALRALWRLSHRDDPPAGLLRARIAALPPQALVEIDRRAPIVIARLAGSPVILLLGALPRAGGFSYREWARTADARELIAATRVLSADSADRVDGRRRGPDRRSASHLEPRILGEVRGVGAQIEHGGRPPPVARLELIRDLVGDWRRATGQEPKSGRSDRSGFGELVYHVFAWLGLSDSSAERTLRRYWDKVDKRLAVVKRRQTRPSRALPDFGET